MRFYSIIVDKPESVIKKVKNGEKISDGDRVCVFRDGICDVEDPEIIALLKKRPDRFRTGKPWPTHNWKDTDLGRKLIKRGNELSIDCRHIRKEYLISLIKQIEAEKRLEGDSKGKRVLDYPELVAKAEILGISTHKKKKEDLFADIEAKEKDIEIGTKEVIING